MRESQMFVVCAHYRQDLEFRNTGRCCFSVGMTAAADIVLWEQDIIL
jgi:hypothetical protein